RPGRPPSHTCPQYVAETRGVSCTCSATDLGQPAGVVRWRGFPGNQLSLSNVNRTQNGTPFVCEVMWNGVRVQSMVYNVQVAYEATILSFDVNSVTSDSLTVNTSDTVTLTCRGVGRPSPEMTLSSATKDAIGHIPPSLQDKVTEVTGSVTAQCRDTGIYTCEASNGVGEKQTRRVTVFVRCKPEVLDNRPGDGGRMETPSLNFTTKAVRLNFHFAAYPTPWLSDIKFFPQRPNTTSVGKPVKGNTIQVACSRHTDDLFNVTCAVTVNDITSSDAGFYQAVIGNSLGDVKVLFQVTVNGGEQDSSLGVGAAVGVAVAVMVVIVVVFFVWLWRRHWVLPCAAATEREADVRLESRNVEPQQGIEHHGQGQPDDYEIQDIEGTTPSEYASLKIDDIGLRSVYSKITPTSTSTRTTVTADTGQVYENTDMSSRRPYVNASDYTR
ncbi:opioid-binding protein/cell adhesion molecule homolog, partial [Littorina saxatilis]|uniref:opioid-binding protein/cell adhesion molecule homolog n=1 Tax=Littorina saxatilis TaxID=31220 RepID=UPI0038B4D765